MKIIELLSQDLHCAGVFYRRFDLTAIAHDAAIGQQSLQVILVKCCHRIDIEVGKSLLKVRPLVLDHLPAEAGAEYRFGDFLQIAGIVCGFILGWWLSFGYGSFSLS